MTLTLSGADIRAGAVMRGASLRAKIIEALRESGPCTTKQIYVAVGKSRAGSVTELLATLVDEGVIVATRAARSDRSGRPPVIWTLAQAADHTNGED